jgi:hypothetical protein
VWPLVMALAVTFTFVVAIYTPWAYPIGFALGIIAFAGWGWPRGEHPKKQVTAGRVPRTKPETT